MPRATATPRWPASGHDLGEALADPQRFAELFPDCGDGVWSAFANAYADACPVVRERMATEKQKALQEAEAQYAAAGGKPRVPMGGKPVGKVAWKKPVGTLVDDVLDGEGRPWARLLNGIRPGNDADWALNLRGTLQSRLDGVDRIRNADTMSERIPSSGGFLVPEHLRQDILMQILETSTVRPLARTIPMDSLRVPIPTIDDISHESSVYGGVAGYWTAEGAALSATAPAWARTDLEARKLTAYTTIPNELLQDSITPLDEWFEMFFPKAVAWFEDFAFISGTGVAEPQGFLNAPAAVRVSSATSNVITFADIVNVFIRIYPECLTSSSLRWFISPDSRGQMLTMAFNAGNAVSPPPWLPQMQAFDAPEPRLFGIPVITSEKIPSSLSGNTTTPGAVALVDLDQYLIGDRQSLQLAESQEYLFASDLVAFRAIERLDGRVWQASAITPANGSTQTLSPVVLLDTTS